MGVVVGRDVTASDVARVLAGPAQLGFCYSADEIRRKAAYWRKASAGLSAERREALLAETPRGQVDGFLAQVEQWDRERARIAGRHRHRERMLHPAGGLPWTEFGQLIFHNPKSILTAERPAFRHSAGNLQYTRPDLLAALDRLAEDTLRIVRVLLLLSLTALRRYPTELLLILLWLITGMATARRTAGWLPVLKRPPQVVRPPGRLVMQGPRVARAPGRDGPSLSLAARAASSCERPGGTP
ncbi:hypothetical protein PV646_03000 [Streptomyces sp. ID05-26A]|nr:hypothetical protein [Streptomyces sp. ID05-26A]